jgi:D-alanine-D-alanine ligase
MCNSQGEFLSSTSLQHPQSPLTVALIYNVKAEASPLATFTASQAQPSSSGSSDVALSSGRMLTISVPGSSERADDLYAEWDTMETISAVRAAIEERYRVLMIEANEDAYQKLLKNKPDFAFNIAEGLHGVSREAQMPAIMDMLQIPYLGSDPLTLSVCLDKARTKEILHYHKVPTAPFTVVSSPDEIAGCATRFPAMVKPLHEGSSKGIYNSCVVRNREDLEREVGIILETYHQPALVEEFLAGREFTVAILGNGADLLALPIVEISFDALPAGVNPIYSYEAKWIWDTLDNPLEIFQCPARIEAVLRDEIETICRNAYRVLKCRDWSRIDVRLDAEGKPHILEINPLPGILPNPDDNSCFPKAARAAGMSYNELINSVLDIAMERCHLPVSRHSRAGKATVEV